MAEIFQRGYEHGEVGLGQNPVGPFLVLIFLQHGKNFGLDAKMQCLFLDTLDTLHPEDVLKNSPRPATVQPNGTIEIKF